jgi:glutamyl-tRNA synthetase
MKALPQLPASPSTAYRGRIAPTPSGWLHHGHAATFLTAWKRARDANGSIVYRDEDIDPNRCRDSYSIGAIEDLRLCGLDWDEGPDVGGPHAPYRQSERIVLYYDILQTLAQQGVIYPSPHSRKEIAKAHTARSTVDQSPLFPSILRPAEIVPCDDPDPNIPWRFRVPAGRSISFIDGRTGQHSFSTNTDFSDFLVWRREGVPAYELAVVVDDHAMEITEVVRGEDLLLSTARQILLYEALGWTPPNWWHCPLVMDPETGQRLSKSNRSLPLHPHRLDR